VTGRILQPLPIRTALPSCAMNVRRRIVIPPAASSAAYPGRGSMGTGPRHCKSPARAVLAIDMIGEFNPQRVLGAPDDPA
jgi:hypothetical protein